MTRLLRRLARPWLARIDARFAEIVDRVVRAQLASHREVAVRDVVRFTVPAIAEALVPATTNAVVPATLEAHSPLLWKIAGQTEPIGRIDHQIHLTHVKLDNIGEELDVVLDSLVREVMRLQMHVEYLQELVEARNAAEVSATDASVSRPGAWTGRDEAA